MTDTPTRKERDRLQRETDFLDAAERLVAERGFHGTTMEDVAHHAEYATGTIYRYFESKEALYQSLIERKGRAYFTSVATRDSEGASPLDVLKGRVAAELDFYESNRAFMRVYHDEMRACDEEKISHMPQDVQDQYAVYMAGWQSLLEDGMADGSFKRQPVELVVVALRGLFRELMQAWVQPNSEFSRTEIETFLLGFLTHGLIHEHNEDVVT